MPRLLFLSQRSPFARKIHILLREKGLAFEPRMVDLAARSAEFQAASPLGKVPMLIDEDGTPVFDSTVIAEYLEDRYPRPAMLGEGFAERLCHRALEELADTIAEQAVTLFFDKDENKSTAKSKSLLERALSELCLRIDSGEVPTTFGLAHAAVISAIDYLELRHSDVYTAGRPALASFIGPHRTRPSIIAAAAPRE